ncbi:MAG: DUF433 domain-containing protein [Anaerolineae bacterium]|nr:DUF433 domain-containing protein [Anaerolineae bacterium]
MAANRISRNPAILGGKPCITGTRIPVTTILEMLEDGLFFDDIVRDYYPQLSAADIKACLEYAKTVADDV